MEWEIEFRNPEINQYKDVVKTIMNVAKLCTIASIEAWIMELNTEVFMQNFSQGRLYKQ